MPPNFKFTKDQILESSFSLVRRSGWTALSTRSLAAEMGSSARPIYSFFTSITELEEEIVKKTVDLLYKYMVRRRTGDLWIDHGIGYVLFAFKEKYLFRAVNDENHIKFFKKHGDLIWSTLTASLADYPGFQGLSEAHIYKIQLTRWLFAHGLAMQANNPPPGIWNMKNITEVMTEGSLAILSGLKCRINNSNPEDRL